MRTFIHIRIKVRPGGVTLVFYRNDICHRLQRVYERFPGVITEKVQYMHSYRWTLYKRIS